MRFSTRHQFPSGEIDAACVSALGNAKSSIFGPGSNIWTPPPLLRVVKHFWTGYLKLRAADYEKMRNAIIFRDSR